MPAATKAPPTRGTTPVLERFYNVKQATVRLGLSDPDNPNDKRGQKWLRDGVNKEGWPCTRMANQLMFSDSQLAQIAELHRNKADGRSKPRPSTGRRRRRVSVRPATP
jgi:hypothetical protein